MSNPNQSDATLDTSGRTTAQRLRITVPTRRGRDHESATTAITLAIDEHNVVTVDATDPRILLVAVDDMPSRPTSFPIQMATTEPDPKRKRIPGAIRLAKSVDRRRLAGRE